MKNGFVYTRWLLSLTFLCLMGLLAVGMMTVHSKRTLRSLAVNIDRKETQLQELGRRQDILDTEMASSLNPGYLKQLVAMAGLRLGPPREDRIILVEPASQPGGPVEKEVQSGPHAHRTRFEFARNDQRERE